MLPFNNNLVSMDLTGAQLLRLLEQQWERPQPAGGRILPVSHGFSYTWDASQPEGAAPGKGQRVVPGSMRLHGEPIVLGQSYRVTVNSFMASGGDALSVFRQGRNVQEGENDLVAAKLGQMLIELKAECSQHKGVLSFHSWVKTELPTMDHNTRAKVMQYAQKLPLLKLHKPESQRTGAKTMTSTNTISTANINDINCIYSLMKRSICLTMQ